MTKYPVFIFDDRFFQDCEYTREELYQLQQKTIELMKTSNDLKKDLKKQTKFNDKEIDTCLSQFHHRGLLKQERVRVEGDILLLLLFLREIENKNI